MIETEVKADELLSEAEKDENIKKKLKSNLRKDEFKTKECPVIKRQSLKNEFKEKECRVISYNKHSKTLDIMFDNYGIRLKNIETFTENTINIKYKGELGRPDFEIKL